MAFDPLASLAINAASWGGDLDRLNAFAIALAEAVSEAEARVTLLEGGWTLQPPSPNPVTARTIGPDVITDTGWKDMGGVAHALHVQRKDAQATGALSMNSTVYVGCDTDDGNPTIGLMYSGIGTRYLTCKYRKSGAWADFENNRGNVDNGRALLIEDVLDFAFEKESTVFVVRRNGTPFEISAGAGTVAANFIAQAFPDGPGKYARYVQTGGTNPLPMEVTLSGGVVQPITLRNSALDGDGHAVFDFDYTGTVAGYLSRRYDTSGNATSDYAPAILVTNPKAGQARYRSPQARAPLAGSAIYEMIEAQDAKTPKPGATPIRVTLVYPQPLKIGQNLALGDAVAAQVNLASGYGAIVVGAMQNINDQYKEIQRGSALMDSRGAITNAPAGTSIYQAISGPDFDFDGQMHELSWLEEGNTTGVSRWNPTFVGERRQTDTIRFGTPSAISYAGGRYYRRFAYNQTSRIDNAFDCGRITWNGQGNLDDIKVAEVGADFNVPGGWRRTYILRFLSELPGFLRTMDAQNANSNKNDTGAFSTRVQPNDNPYGRSDKRGMPFEKIIALNVLTGRDIYAIIQPNWTESMVKGFVRGLFTGEGMQGGIKVRDDCTVYLDVTGNEPFNTASGFWIYFYFAGIGQAAGITNANQARLYAQTLCSNRVKQWINEATSEFRSRIVTVDCGSPGNHPYEWGVMNSYGLTKPDAFTRSIYWGIGAKGTTVGNNTPAEVAANWDADVDKQVDAFFLNIDTYRKAGVRSLSYEIGSDNFSPGSAMTRDQKLAWAASPQYAASFERMWNRIRAEGGDAWGIYYDIGDTSEWAHKSPVPGASNPKWDIIKRVQAAADAQA